MVNAPTQLNNVVSYPTVGDFPTTGTKGVWYFDLSTGTPYIWDGTQYQDIDPTADDIWERDGTTIKPQNDGDNLDILSGSYVYNITTPLAKLHFSPDQDTTTQNSSVDNFGSGTTVQGQILSGLNLFGAINFAGFWVDDVDVNGLNFANSPFIASNLRTQGSVTGFLADDLSVDAATTSRGARGFYARNINVNGTNASQKAVGFEASLVTNTNNPDNAWGFYDSTAKSYFNGNIGINTLNPDKRFVISDDDNPVIKLNNTDTVLTTAQVIGTHEFYTNDASTNATGVAGFLRFKAEDTEGSNSVFELGTRIDTDADARTVFSIDSDGDSFFAASEIRLLGLTGEQSILRINSDVGQYASLILQDGGSDKWKFEKTNGGDFTITEHAVAERLKINDTTGILSTKSSSAEIAMLETLSSATSYLTLKSATGEWRQNINSTTYSIYDIVGDSSRLLIDNSDRFYFQNNKTITKPAFIQTMAASDVIFLPNAKYGHVTFTVDGFGSTLFYASSTGVPNEVASSSTGVGFTFGSDSGTGFAIYQFGSQVVIRNRTGVTQETIISYQYSN